MIIPGYGMTEVVVLSHITPLGTPIDDERYLGSCGKLLPGFQAKVSFIYSLFSITNYFLNVVDSFKAFEKIKKNENSAVTSVAG